MILNIRHIGIVVRDIQHSINFYKEHLGFSIKKDAMEASPFVENVLAVRGACLRTVKMLSPSSDVMVELVYYVSGEVIENYNRINQFGPTHFAVSVKNINKMYAKMLSEGVEFLSEPTVSPDNYAKIAFCQAPEGTYIELVELLVNK